MSEIDFEGRGAIVTGAGHGLGRDYALALAARGAGVVVNDIGTEDDGTPRAEKVVAEIEAAGGRAVANLESVAERAAAQRMVEAAADSFGSIDAVVNNAGIVGAASVEELEVDFLDAMLAVHLKGAILLSQAAFARMREQGYGRIVNLTSSAGVFGMTSQIAYAAAKTGVIGATNVLAQEGAEHGIKANAVLPYATTNPGRTQTRYRPEEMEALEGPRMSTAFVRALVLYLASERCEPSGELFSALSGRYARVFVGVAPGWLSLGDEAPGPEDIAANIAAIEAREGYSVPVSIEDEYGITARQVIAAQS